MDQTQRPFENPEGVLASPLTRRRFLAGDRHGRRERRARRVHTDALPRRWRRRAALRPRRASPSVAPSEAATFTLERPLKVLLANHTGLLRHGHPRVGAADGRDGRVHARGVRPAAAQAHAGLRERRRVLGRRLPVAGLGRPLRAVPDPVRRARRHGRRESSCSPAGIEAAKAFERQVLRPAEQHLHLRPLLQTRRCSPTRA